MASSVPSQALVLLGDLVEVDGQNPRPARRWPRRPPPAPKSLQRLIRREASGLRKRRWSFRSSGALPFCTSAPQVSREAVVWDLEEPVAPPQPSRPVRPPRRIHHNPRGAGRSPPGRWRQGQRRSPRRSPCAWRHSRGGRARPPGRWPGRSGCHRREYPRSRLGDDGPLGELAGHGLLNGGEGVGRAGQAHGGVDIGPAGKGVPDGAAHAGGCAAEGLNLRRGGCGFRS